MLTRAFLLMWYTNMMPRIEEAGHTIRQGFRETRLKRDNTPVTDADMASHKILTTNWFRTPIMSEENFQPIRGNGSVFTWVDPLDATQEYTEGLTDYVSIMACLTEYGHPKAGIVHFPFRNETWAVIGDEWLERPAMSFQPPEKVLISRSHPGDIRKTLAGFNLEAAGGSGYKAAEVLRGRALAYVHETKIKTWDICALDAITRASNGSFVEWTTGKPFIYNKAVHENGLFMSETMSREWFRMAAMVRSPIVQLLILGVIWFGIYMYPIGTLRTPKKEDASPFLGFAKCAAALIVTYVVWGVAQERIMSIEYGGQRFVYPAVLVFVNRLVASTFASYFVKPPTTSFFNMSVASLSNVVSSLCQYTALQYTIFPLVVVFKSLKMIPVLIVGRCFFKKRYKPIAYALAVALAVGVGLCMYATRPTIHTSHIYIFGVMLLLGYAVADAVTSQWQSYLFRTYKTPPLEMMYGVNTCSMIFTGVNVFLSGQLDATISWSIDHPEFLLHVACLCVPAVLGQWFIFKTIEHHGAASFSMIMTARQAISLTVSCLLFGHRFDWPAYLGFAIVIGTLAIKTRIKLESKEPYDKLPQTDPEAGYDSIDEYELESDHED